MFIPRLRLPSGPLVLVLDLLVLAWVVGFALVGLLVYDTVQELGAISRSLGTVGRAVQDTGGAIGALQVPLVGGAISSVARQVQEAGQVVIASAADSQAAIDRLALVTGLVVGIVPSLPLLAFYALPRVGRALEANAVRAALSESAGDPGLARFLAERATVNLSLRELRRVSPAPWRDLEAGEFDALAQAELRRLGVRGGLLARARR